MISICHRARRLSILLTVFAALTLHACRSSNNNQARQESVPLMHHAPEPSSSASSGRAKLIEGMGHVDFPITTNSKEAQAFFNQGVAQLYGFWFGKAEDSFAE